MRIRLNGIMSSLLWLTMFITVMAGCSVFLPVSVPPITTYQISVLHGNSLECKSNASAADIQITRMKADEPYDSINMFYSWAKYQLSSYSRHQWVATPS